MAHYDHTSSVGPTASEALARAHAHAEGFRPVCKRARLGIVVCMDNRINPAALLGLDDGDAYIIRNAGGILTDDVRRSLAVAQHILGVEDIVLIHHTDCGMNGLDDDAFASTLATRSGLRPTWRPGGFTSAEADLRDMLAALAADPHIPSGERARGFLYDVTTGTLTEVTRT